MQQATYLIGSIAKIAIAGAISATPTAGTVGRDFIPDNAAVTAAASNVWLDVGVIEQAEEQTSSSKIEIFRPSPGVLQLDDIKETKLKRELTLTISECSNPMWLLLRRSLKATASISGALGQHVPLSGGTQKMWLKMQSYDGETNALLLSEQIWGYATIDGAVSMGGDKAVQFKVKFSQLWSPLNSATGA